MNVIEINTFERAILYEFQRTRKVVLDFSQLCKLCAAVSPNLPEPIPADSERDKFVAELSSACVHLFDVGVALLFRDPDGHIQFIRLTDAGQRAVDDMVFSHTNRIPLDYTRPQFKLGDILCNQNIPPGAKR